MAIVITDAELIRLLFIFWLPAYIAHLIGFIIANHDDIFISWKVFFLGDIAGWGIVCGVTVLLLNFWDTPRWVLYVVYGFHMIVTSTILSDAAMYQETISMTNLKELFIETIVESILIPWAAGVGVGVICVLIFGI